MTEPFEDSEALDEATRLALYNALMDSIENPKRLAVAIYFRTNFRLEDEVRIDNAKSVVIGDVIKLAVGQRWVSKLILAALDAAPASLPIQSVAGKLRVCWTPRAVDSEPEASSSDAARHQIDGSANPPPAPPERKCLLLLGHPTAGAASKPVSEASAELERIVAARGVSIDKTGDGWTAIADPSSQSPALTSTQAARAIVVQPAAAREAVSWAQSEAIGFRDDLSSVIQSSDRGTAAWRPSRFIIWVPKTLDHPKLGPCLGPRADGLEFIHADPGGMANLIEPQPSTDKPLLTMEESYDDGFVLRESLRERVATIVHAAISVSPSLQWWEGGAMLASQIRARTPRRVIVVAHDLNVKPTSDLVSELRSKLAAITDKIRAADATDRQPPTRIFGAGLLHLTRDHHPYNEYARPTDLPEWRFLHLEGTPEAMMPVADYERGFQNRLRAWWFGKSP